MPAKTCYVLRDQRWTDELMNRILQSLRTPCCGTPRLDTCAVLCRPSSYCPLLAQVSVLAPGRAGPGRCSARMREQALLALWLACRSPTNSTHTQLYVTDPDSAKEVCIASHASCSPYLPTTALVSASAAHCSSTHLLHRGAPTAAHPSCRPFAILGMEMRKLGMKDVMDFVYIE